MVKARVLDARVEMENVHVGGYFSGRLPKIIFVTNEGDVHKMTNKLPPSNTTVDHANKIANDSIGRLVSVNKDTDGRMSGEIIPHVVVSVWGPLFSEAQRIHTEREGGVMISAAPIRNLLPTLLNGQGIDASGGDVYPQLENGKFRFDNPDFKFRIEYAESDEHQHTVERILSEYLDEVGL